MAKNILYSTHKTPEQRPPRFDLRNRPKKNIDQSPKFQNDLPDSDLKATDISEDGLFNFLQSRIDDPDGTAPERTRAEPLPQETPNKAAPTKIKPDNQTTKTMKSNGVRLAFNERDWVFTQATAVASVNFTKDRSWQITTDTIQYINANGNSWGTDYLRKVYKTFVGAKNLKDHIDTDAGGKIYGIILDAIPRKIKVPRSGYVLYIDTIIATNKHIDPEWADAIKKGKIKFLSVGFRTDYLMCSKCGHIYGIDGTGICQHTAFETGMGYYDEYGRKSKVSAVATDNDGMCKSGFIELSYLSVDPAFEGAAQAYQIEVPKGQDVIVTMPKNALKRPALKAFKDQYRILK